MTGAAKEPGDWLRAEIAEQPARWRELVTGHGEELAAAARLLREADPELVVLVARGSSDHAAQAAQYLVHDVLGVPALLATPASFTVHGARLRFPRAVALAVSQSGASPDLLATVDAHRRAGVPVIGFTNDDTSPLAARADLHVPLAAGLERSVAATKTYTAEIVALSTVVRLAADPAAAGSLAGEVLAVADAAERVLASVRPAAEDVAAQLTGADRLLAVGRGYGMATAKEAALKLTETSALPASGWSAADATHGPLGQVVAGTPVLALTVGAGGRDSVLAFADQARALGARVLTTGRDAGATFRVDAPTAVHPVLDTVLEILPVQLLAARLSVRRGLDPDRPAALRKVTLTR